MTNLPKSKYLLRNLVIKQKVCKKIGQITSSYTFLKTLDQKKLNMQKHFQIFKTLMCIQEKLKMFKFSLAKTSAKLLCKNFAICLLLLQAFQKAIKC